MLNDIQSNSLVTDVSFTTRLLEETVAVVQQGTRDLRVDRAAFLPTQPALSEEQALAAYGSYVKKAVDSGFSPLAEDDFLEQLLAASSNEIFRQILNSAGIETEYTEDLTVASSTSIPYQEDRGAFLLSEQIINDISNPPVVADITASVDLASKASYAALTKHLIESDPFIVADLDPTIHANTLKALTYVQTYLK